MVGNLLASSESLASMVGNLPASYENLASIVGNLLARYGNLASIVGNLLARYENLASIVGNLAARFGSQPSHMPQEYFPQIKPTARFPSFADGKYIINILFCFIRKTAPSKR
jgi:hypothetical protein